MDNSRQLKLGAIMSYGVMAINIIIGLFYTPWMIQTIGKENYGLYSLAMSVITLFVFDFGLSIAVTRFLSKYLAENNIEKANNCLGIVFKLYVAIDSLILIVLTSLYFFLPSLYQNLTPEEMDKFKVLYCIVAIYSVLSFPFIPLNGILTAHEKYVQLKIAEFAHKIIIVVSMSLCLLLGYGLYALVLVNAFAGISMIMLKLFFIKRFTNQGINISYNNKFELNNLLKFSGWITVCAVAQRFIFNIAPSILAALSGAASVAILSIATGLEAYSYTFSSAISGLLLPKVTRTLNSNQGNILLLMIKVGRIQLYVVGLILMGFIVFGRDFISLWVGSEFEESFICTLLIIMPMVLYIPLDVGVQALMVMNKVRYQAYIYVGMAVLNIVLSLVLAKMYGAIGMCLSIFISYIFRTIGMFVIIHRTMAIDIFVFIKSTYTSCILPFFFIILIGVLLNYLFVESSWILLIVKIGIFTVAYGVLLFFMAMNQFEKSLIKSIIRL